RLLDALRPLQPERVRTDDSLDADAVEINLGDSEGLDAWEVRVCTDSPALLETTRELIAGLGFRHLGQDLGLQEKNQLLYGGASAFARQVLRWQLRRRGLKLEEHRQEDWDDDDDDIVLMLADPALAGVPPLERFAVEVESDEPEAARRLCERLAG